MKLYVIRHGQSETNKTGCYTGWAQVSLTEKGVEDAKSIRPLLDKVPFDKIFTSDLIRARQTAENAIPGCTYEQTPLLREINVGTLAGRPSAGLTEQEKQKIQSSGYVDFDGESREDLKARIHTFLSQVETLDCEYVAAFSHAGFLLSMLREIIGPSGKKNAICCGNCTVAIYEYTDGNWQRHSGINPQ